MYAKLETVRYGREWTTSQLFQGFVGDVGDLSKLITAKEGVRTITSVDDRLAHEFADCLWSLIILADRLGIDLEKAFVEGMSALETRVRSEKSLTAHPSIRLKISTDNTSQPGKEEQKTPLPASKSVHVKMQ